MGVALFFPWRFSATAARISLIAVIEAPPAHAGVPSAAGREEDERRVAESAAYLASVASEIRRVLFIDANGSRLAINTVVQDVALNGIVLANGSPINSETNGQPTLDETRDSLAKKIAGSEWAKEGDWLSAAAVERESGLTVGDMALHWVSERDRTAEIGFVFDPRHQGKGFATEAARALVDWAFREAGMHRVIGRTEARNAASARVLEKLGMRLEAHLVENEWVKGEWQSELVYAVLEREWS